MLTMDLASLVRTAIDSARLRDHGLTDRTATGDLYPAVEVAIDLSGSADELPTWADKRIRRDIEIALHLTTWTREGVQTTPGGQVWTYRRPAHRPRLDPTVTRVKGSWRVHPDTLAHVDQWKSETRSAGIVVDQLTDCIPLGFRLVRIRYQRGSAAGKPVIEASILNGNIAPKQATTEAAAGEALIEHMRTVRKLAGPICYDGDVPIAILLVECDEKALMRRGKLEWR